MGLHLEIWSKKQMRKNEKQQKRKKKYIAYRGLLLLYRRGKGPLAGTLAIFLDVLGRDSVMGNPMNGTEQQ